MGCDAGDWEALYVDGEKKREGHSLHWSHVLEALEIPYTECEAVALDPRWPETVDFPDRLAE